MLVVLSINRYLAVRMLVSFDDEFMDCKSFHVCIRHLTSSVGQRASDENTAAKLPAAILSMVVNCS
jgi:hypothetical protein